MSGGLARLDELTAMKTRAMDELRAASPLDCENWNRVSEVHAAVLAERGEEVGRLTRAGRTLADLGSHLGATDPYYHGVPDNRPVRQRTTTAGRDRPARS